MTFPERIAERETCKRASSVVFTGENATPSRKRGGQSDESHGPLVSCRGDSGTHFHPHAPGGAPLSRTGLAVMKNDSR